MFRYTTGSHVNVVVSSTYTWSKLCCVNMVGMCKGIVYLPSLMVINIFLFPLVTVRGERALCCWLFARFFSLGCRIPVLNALGTTGPKWLVRSREIF